MIVDFYYLTQTPLERVLPSICEKVLASGERLLVVAEERLLARLDEQLWTGSRESFVPHGRDNPGTQPVLLSTQAVALNGALNVAVADGRWREEALGFVRAFYFFDSASQDEARDVWRELKGREGVESRYWKQDERGKWVQGP